MRYEELKQRHRNVRDQHPANLTLRVHRALSWLKRAEQADDMDGRFIFLWIAFNAAYAYEIDAQERLYAQGAFTGFLEKLCDLDQGKRLDALVWHEFTGSIRTLLDNPYVFEAFWQFQRGQITEEQWKERFAKGKRAAQVALGSGKTAVLLGVVFSRIYTLRNQLMHGGATWNGQVNREQLRDCCKLMTGLVPVVIELMMDNPNTLWGDPCYPVVE